MNVTSSDDPSGHVTVPTMMCRRSRSLDAHSLLLGLPAVVGWLKPKSGGPNDHDDWSHARWYVYDALSRIPLSVNALSDAVICAVFELSFEPIS